MSTTSHVTLYAGDNTHRLRLVGLRDPDGLPVTDATVTARVYESDGQTEVGGVTWPLTLGHESNGTYAAQIPSAAVITHGKLYVVEVKAIAGTERGHWRETGVRARNRGF